MVCLPELGNNEEVLSLHDAFLDGAGDTLTTGLLVAVICWKMSLEYCNWVVRVKESSVKLSPCGAGALKWCKGGGGAVLQG
jgi:hypothetical protein